MSSPPGFSGKMPLSSNHENWYPCTNLYEFIVLGFPGIIGVKIMVFNATFNNMSVILWRSVLVVEETGVLGENDRPAKSH
jgi:hypothetical protein